MKKLYLLIAFIPYCLLGFAGNHESRVVTKDSAYVGKKFIIGEKQAKLILNNGTKISFPLEQIVSYSSNGKEFRKLPLYVDGKPTNQLVFMELVKVQDNLKLFRYCKSTYCPYSKVVTYLLFDGAGLSLAYEDKTLP
ncbi:MAG TPA: hypothetical protein VK179_15755 [Bacteroidales bacterium]|nr:hypothetical protein [Bacteroidales bacterium]